MTRQIEGARARILAVSAGMSFIDEYLSEPVIVLKEDGTIASEPPPAGDVDLLVNGVYHLVDKGEYIGAGPAIIRPIELIAPGRM
ncbi:MAG: hypothetical protein ACE5H5_00060, partial [Nitrospinota bacterium]